MYPESICPYDGSDQSFGLRSCPNTVYLDPSRILCTGAYRIQDCSEAEKATIYGAGKIPGDLYVKLAMFLEEEENCAGMCRTCPYKLYTDCDDNPYIPERCDSVFVELINGKFLNSDIDYASAIAGISSGAVALCIIDIIALCCMCYHKTFNEKTSPE